MYEILALNITSGPGQTLNVFPFYYQHLSDAMYVYLTIILGI